MTIVYTTVYWILSKLEHHIVVGSFFARDRFESPRRAALASLFAVAIVVNNMYYIRKRRLRRREFGSWRQREETEQTPVTLRSTEKTKIVNRPDDNSNVFFFAAETDFLRYSDYDAVVVNKIYIFFFSSNPT